MDDQQQLLILSGRSVSIMKSKYDSPEFDVYKLRFSNQILNPSVKTDEEPVPGVSDGEPIEE